ncbi:MAG: glycosyltransferase [Acidobacteria bacterium]|nr:glycosyltransferase [Acidobacteriota bacterium]
MKIVYSHYSFQYSGIDGFAARLFQLLSRETTVDWEIVTTHIPDQYAHEVQQWGTIHSAPEGLEAYSTFLCERIHNADLLIATSPYDLFAARTIAPKMPIWFWAHGVTPVWNWMCRLCQTLDVTLFHINPQLARNFHCSAGRHWVPRYDLQKHSQTCLELLYFGRLDWVNKRCHWGLQLIKAIQKTGLDIRLDYVGSGPGEAALREKIHKMHLGNQVRLLPPVSPFGDQSWMGRYHHILSFSKLECTPLGVLEGVSQGLLPIYTPVPFRAFDYLADAPLELGPSPKIAAMVALISAHWTAGTTRTPDQYGPLAQHFQTRFSPEQAISELRPFLLKLQARKPDSGAFDSLWSANCVKFGFRKSRQTSLFSRLIRL